MIGLYIVKYNFRHCLHWLLISWSHPNVLLCVNWVFPKCFHWFFAEFGDKNICHYSKKAQTCHTATSCARYQIATTVPARHMWETGSLKLTPNLCFIDSLNSVNACSYLGTTPISAASWAEKSERMKPAWNTFHKKHSQFVQNGTVMRAFLKRASC